MSEREQSVSSLADALSRSDAPASAGPPRLALAKPSRIARVLIAAVMVLSLLYAAGLLVLGSRVSSLVAEMRVERQQREHREREALPSAEVLRDAEATRRETIARPLAAGRIWEARCAALATAGDWAGVQATCERVTMTDPGGLLPGARLLQAEALHRLGRHAESARILHGIDPTALDEAGRARAADLAGRLWSSVEGPAEQPGQPASE